MAAVGVLDVTEPIRLIPSLTPSLTWKKMVFLRSPHHLSEPPPLNLDAWLVRQFCIPSAERGEIMTQMDFSVRWEVNHHSHSLVWI